VHLLWTQKISAPLRGLSLARERGWVLAWDAQDGLHLWDRAGRRQAHRPAPAALAAAACADDGGSVAAAGGRGQVWLLAPDLTPRWERAVPQPALAVAIDPFGEHVAVADGGGGVHLFNREGRPMWQASTPRPLRHLTFVPEKPVLVGSADFGLVLCLDAGGTCLWRDGLVAHVGSLAASGDGGAIVLACFTDGLCRYAVDRPQPQRLPQAAPCHLAAQSYTADTLLTAGAENEVCLRERDATVRARYSAEGAVVALALAALGDFAVLALAEGKVQGLAP
jgi:outer membrane protein assembly factor BamB